MRIFKDYEEFHEYMLEKFPLMYSQNFGGFEIEKGWWPVIYILSNMIQGRIDHNRKQIDLLTKNNPYNTTIPEKIPQVEVIQVKEKFAGLRFYYNGGDDRINGFVSMAEAWCGNTCEECGVPGITRTGGWMRTLCDEHALARGYKDE